MGISSLTVPAPSNRDAQNQLLAINEGTHRSEFSYDGRHHRQRAVERENGSVVTDHVFIWDWEEVAERRTLVGTTGTTRVYGFAIDDNGTSRYLTFDHLMSVREVLDSNGAIATRYDYDPFGISTRTLGSGSDMFEFTGVLTHGQSGLLLMWHRIYQPDTGRWLSEDPLRLKAGPNLYTYVGNRPLTEVDPDGTWGYKPNGSLTSWYTKQDWHCSSMLWGYLENPLVRDSNPCHRRCCIEHDGCYQQFRCNWTSWIHSADYYFSAGPVSPCDICNRIVVNCIRRSPPPSTCGDRCSAIPAYD